MAAQYRRVAIFIYPRSGTPANLISSVSIIPRDGVGKTITLPYLAARVGLSLPAGPVQTSPVSMSTVCGSAITPWNRETAAVHCGSRPG